jgi:hypothetical protein
MCQEQETNPSKPFMQARRIVRRGQVYAQIIFGKLCKD